MKKIFTLMLFTIISASIYSQTNWTRHENPVLPRGEAGSWESDMVGMPAVLIIDNVYHMWYNGLGNGKIQIGHATSNDGISWTKDPQNPVLKNGASGSWDSYRAYIPEVYYKDDTFHMWYVGATASSVEAMGYATSTDGTVWTKYENNPVFASGNSGEWDDGGAGPGAIYYEGDQFQMFYGGSGKTTSEMIKMGLATSPDGITWTRNAGNPLFENAPGFWDDPRVQATSVIKDETGYKMWYCGGEFMKWRIGYATSEDGLSWNRSPLNPVLDLGESGTWDSKQVSFPYVLYDATHDVFKMWYSGGNIDFQGDIGYAESSPLVTINVPGDYTTIQAAIDASTDGDIVLVAEGTYFENINFKGKAITVASLLITDGDTAHVSKTIIDGSQPTHADTASVVSMISGEDSTSVLNGFTITGGKGTKWSMQGFSDVWIVGGGINIDFSGGKIINNRIEGNSLYSEQYPVQGAGIGVYVGKDFHVVIRNNKVSNNTSSSTQFPEGGGMGIYCSDGYLLCENNVISKNVCTGLGSSAALGGGICAFSVSPWKADFIIRNNRIFENGVSGKIYAVGAGIYSYTPYDSELFMDAVSKYQIYNNLITGNISQHYGGGIALWGELPYANSVNPAPLIFNNTIIGNQAEFGAGISNHNSKPLLFNNVFWNNATGSGGKEFYNGTYGGVNNGSFVTFNNDIKGGWEGGENNINADPGCNLSTFALESGSLCIGAGAAMVEVNGVAYYAPESDYAGKPRPNPIDNLVDIGAIESDFSFPTGFRQIVIDNNPIQVYPNPTSNLLTIETEYSDHYSINITTLNGQQILIGEMEGTTHQIDLTSFQKGIYFITIRSEHFVTTRKIIKL